jgi:general secretion pathway protein J
MSRLRPAPNAAGFTLIEMLVTMTLLALIVVVLFGGLQFGARAWEGAQAHGSLTEELRVVQNLIRRELEQAYPYYDTSDTAHPVVDFHGGQDWVEFLAPSPTGTGSVGRDRVTIRTEHAGAKTRLTIRGIPEMAGARNAAWSSVLLENVEAVHISYLSAGTWTAGWRGAETMPSLVRIQVTFPAGDGRAWPDLVIAPRIEADVACDFDVESKRCRGRI